MLVVLLTISTTMPSATDLGYLLHKHPGRVQAFDVPYGVAHVFYPEVSDDRTTAALLLEVDPVGLVRGRSGPSGEGFALGQYVNDRPYAASSLLAVAIKQVFATALSGRCTSHPELAAARLPLELGCPRCRAAAARTWPGGSSSRSAGRSRRCQCRSTRPSRPGATRPISA